MKSRITVGLLALALAVGAFAGEKKWTLSDWLRDLDARIRKVQDKNKNRKSAVAAVRGAKVKPSTKLYWKGEKAEVTDEELSEFKAAVDLAQSGDGEAARAALDAFVKKHPGSALKADVEETRSLLAAAPAPASETAAPAPEAPTPQ